MKKKMTFIQSLKEMDVEFNVPSANGGEDEYQGEPGEMNQSELDDKQVEVSSVVTMDSDFFSHLLQSASEMDEDELATIAAEMIEKAKTKKVLTMDDFDEGGDDIEDTMDDGIEDTMDDDMDDEMLDQTQTPGKVDPNEMRPEEECEMSGY